MLAHRKRLLRSLAIAAIALAASDCGLFEPDPEDETRHEALETARARWEQADLQAYSFTLHKSCYCLYTAPVRITVVDGEIDSVTALPDGAQVPEDQWLEFSTVEELFDMIERAIDESADELDVDYHWLLGHPTRISLDWAENAVDDELTVELEDLKALDGP